MNYRHIYHAGNWVDVIKHILLIESIKLLKNKDKAFTIIDNFAGCGLYDLNDEKSQKTLEAKDGIKKFYEYITNNKISQYSDYIDIVKFFNKDADLTRYPGSPLIILKMLREIDKAIFYELHPEDFRMLKNNTKNYSNCHMHKTDGYLAQKISLPLSTSRGLVFSDPCFEQQGEFDKLIASLKIQKARAINIASLIWYPIKSLDIVEKFYQELRNLKFSDILMLEIERVDSFMNLTKIGFIYINPPKLDIEQILQPLKKIWNITLNVTNI
jgi:23S rRNA (adenine2030-N6)-methyltransferase